MSLMHPWGKHPLAGLVVVAAIIILSYVIHWGFGG